MVLGLPPCWWWIERWLPRPPQPLVPPAPSSSCCRGWGSVVPWNEQGCQAPLSPRWASGSSCPGSPGSPGAPGTTGPTHPPRQIPEPSLVQNPLWAEKRKKRKWTRDTGSHGRVISECPKGNHHYVPTDIGFCNIKKKMSLIYNKSDANYYVVVSNYIFIFLSYLYNKHMFLIIWDGLSDFALEISGRENQRQYYTI